MSDEPCPICSGTGEHLGNPCPECDGTGTAPDHDHDCTTAGKRE